MKKFILRIALFLGLLVGFTSPALAQQTGYITLDLTLQPSQYKGAHGTVARSEYNSEATIQTPNSTGFVNKVTYKMDAARRNTNNVLGIFAKPDAGYHFVHWADKDNTSSIPAAASEEKVALYNALWKDRIYRQLKSATGEEIVGRSYKYSEFDFYVVDVFLFQHHPSHTLFAVFEPNEYQISFKDGDADVLTPKTITYNEKYGVLPTYEKAGFTFDGWCTDADCKSAVVSANDTYTIVGNQTLYAKCTPISHTIHFVDQEQSQTFADATYTGITMPTLSKAGYLKNVTDKYFAGFYTRPNGQGTRVYAGCDANGDGNLDLFNPLTLTSDITLYAHYSHTHHNMYWDYSYDMGYDPQNPTASHFRNLEDGIKYARLTFKKADGTVIKTIIMTATTPTGGSNPDETFDSHLKSWANIHLHVGTNEDVLNAQNVEVYFTDEELAAFAAYTFEAISVKSPATVANNWMATTDKAAHNTVLTFVGAKSDNLFTQKWSVKLDGLLINPDVIYVMPLFENETGNWEAISQLAFSTGVPCAKTSVDGDIATYNGSYPIWIKNTTNYYYNNAIGLVGFNLGGKDYWMNTGTPGAFEPFYNSAKPTSPIDTLPGVNTGKTPSKVINMTVPATAIPVIHFLPNGGKLSPATPEYLVSAYDATVTLKENETFNYSATRPGYDFVGWMKDASEGGTMADNTLTMSQAYTLHAQWRGSEYTVTLHHNNGVNPEGMDVVTANFMAAMPNLTTLPTPIALPTRTGYDFKGYLDTANVYYYDDAGASARVYDKMANSELWANWTPKTYSVTLAHNDGSGTTETATATYGEAFPTITIPTRPGYAFLGYYFANPGGDSTQYVGADGHGTHAWDKTDINVTLYAHWEKAYYHVTYHANFDGDGGATHVRNFDPTTPAIAGVYAGMPIPEDMRFDGWEDDQGNYYSETATLPTLTEDGFHLYAQWTDVPVGQKFTIWYGKGTFRKDTWNHLEFTQSESGDRHVWESGHIEITEDFKIDEDHGVLTPEQKTNEMHYFVIVGDSDTEVTPDDTARRMVMGHMGVAPCNEEDGTCRRTVHELILPEDGEQYKDRAEVFGHFHIWTSHTAECNFACHMVRDFYITYYSNFPFGLSEQTYAKIVQFETAETKIIDNPFFMAKFPDGLLTFQGWSRTKDGEVDFRPNDIFPFNPDRHENVKLYAVWTVNEEKARNLVSHQKGAYDEFVNVNGHDYQQVHTYERYIIMKPGESQRLYRPDWTSYRNYVRWYNFEEDAACPNLTYSGNFGADRTFDNVQGKFFIGQNADGTVTFTAPTGEHNFDTEHYANGITVACDQSAYTDGSFESFGFQHSYLFWFIYDHNRDRAAHPGPFTLEELNDLSVDDEKTIYIAQPLNGGFFMSWTTTFNGSSMSSANLDLFNARSFSESIYHFKLTKKTADGGFTIESVSDPGKYFMLKSDMSYTFRAPAEGEEATVWYFDVRGEETPETNLGTLDKRASNHTLLRLHTAGNKYFHVKPAGWRNVVNSYAVSIPSGGADVENTEPTLSQRLLFHIIPASRIADILSDEHAWSDPAAMVNLEHLPWMIRKRDGSSNNFRKIRYNELNKLPANPDDQITAQIIWPESKARGGYALTNYPELDNKYTSQGYYGWVRDWHSGVGDGVYTIGDNWDYTFLTIRHSGIVSNDTTYYYIIADKDGTTRYLTVSGNGTNATWETEKNGDNSLFAITRPVVTLRLYNHPVSTTDNGYLMTIKSKSGHYLTSKGNYLTPGGIDYSTSMSKDDLESAKFLANQNILVPTGQTFSIGPTLQWKQNNQFDYSAHTYYYRDGSELKPCTEVNGRWQWRKDGVAITPTDVHVGRFAVMTPEAHPGKHIYTLQYIPNSLSSGKQHTFNVVRFNVEFASKALIGPSSTLGYTAVENAQEVAREDFNFEVTPEGAHPNSTVISHGSDQVRFYNKPLTAPEAAYGFYNGGDNHYGGGSQRKFPFWGEYGLVSTTAKSWGIESSLAQHDETVTLDGSNPETGYCIYIDGSTIPGQVFELDVDGLTLCSNSKMYCSAWVASVTEEKWTKPNFDFEVFAYNTDTKEEAVVTTYTTGELTVPGKWQHVLFPVIYHGEVGHVGQGKVQFRVRVINKGKNASGNDFAIDDIAFYVKHAPFTAIQATTSACLESGEKKVMPLYLRVDYELLVAEEGEDHNYFYGWFDDKHQAVSGTYFTGGTLPPGSTQEEIAAHGNKFGSIALSADLTGKPVFNSFREFDDYITELADNDGELTAQRAYVYELGKDGRERPFLYIVQPLAVQANRTYHVVMSNHPAEVMSGNHHDNTCALLAELDVIAGARIRVDGEVFTHETDICGNHTYTLDVEMRYVMKDAQTSEYITQTIACDADWLLGNGSIIEKNKELYGVNALNRTNVVTNYGVPQTVLNRFSTDVEKDSVARFQAIYRSIVAYRTPETATIQQKNLVEHLLNNNLLVLKKSQFVVFVNADHSHYLAFPRAKDGQDESETSHICPEPQEVFFKISNVMGQGVIIARHDDVLPDDVLNNPRNVRVQHGVVTQDNAEIIMPLHQIANEHGFVIVGAESVLRDAQGQPLYSLQTEMYDQAGAGRQSVAEVTQEGCVVALTGDWLRAVEVGEYDFMLTMQVPEHLQENSCAIRYAYFKLIVTPDILNWNQTVSVWNADLSWDAFDHTAYHYVPLPTTQVIMPNVAKTVPLPTAEPAVSQKIAVEEHAQDYITYDIYGDTNDDNDFYYRPYSCSDIYFPVGASLMNQSTLNIGGQAFIDVPYAKNKWQLTSFPIHGVVSGDIFIPHLGDNPGTTHPFEIKKINQTDNVADRTTYPFYQNLYNTSVMNTTGSGSCQEEVQSSTWLTNTEYDKKIHTSGRTANGLAIPYGYEVGNQAAAAFYLFNNGAGNDTVVRLPKEADVTYKYYDKITNQWIGYLSDVITRSANYGKPVYTGDSTFTLRGTSPSNIFLFGNPTFAYIDMTAFMAGNTSTLSGKYYRLLKSNYVTNLGPVGADASTGYYLPPYSAVLVEKSGAAATEVAVTVSDAMLVASVPTTPSAAPSRQSSVLNPQSSTIFMSATSDDFTTYAMVEEDPTATNHYDENEDADVFLMAPAQTPFVLYTGIDGHAMAINRHQSLDYLPLSIFTQIEDAPVKAKVTIAFTGDDAYVSEWDLMLLSTGKLYPLSNNKKYALSMYTDGTPAAALVHTRAHRVTTAIADESSEALHVYAHGGHVYCCADCDMHRIEVLSPAGQLVCTANEVGTYHEFNLAPGVYLVRVDGKVFKVFND